MNIIDTNGVQHVLKNNLVLQESYYLVPDVEDEVEMTLIIHGKRLPARIFRIAQFDAFNEGIYLRHYQTILNKYGGRSFYNMTGFGDISILAALLMLNEVQADQQQTQLFQTLDQVNVFTDDNSLIKKIKIELASGNIAVLPTNDIS